MFLLNKNDRLDIFGQASISQMRDRQRNGFMPAQFTPLRILSPVTLNGNIYRVEDCVSTAPKQSSWDQFLTVRDASLSKLTHRNLQEKYCLLLLVRIMELCQDAQELLELGRVASIPVILRSAIESYVDLQLMIASEEHIEFMNSSLNERMSRIFKDVDEEKYEEFRDKISVPDTWRKKIKHKFYDAGKKGLYQGLYAHLCRHAHGNLEALLQDHTRDNKIALGHTPEPAVSQFYARQILVMAVASLRDVLVLFGAQAEDLQVLDALL